MIELEVVSTLWKELYLCPSISVHSYAQAPKRMYHAAFHQIQAAFLRHRPAWKELILVPMLHFSMVCQITQCVICIASASMAAIATCDISTGTTGNELVQELDERAFSFFNDILDYVMRPANATSSSHESLGHALNEAMAKAGDILNEMHRNAAELDAGLSNSCSLPIRSVGYEPDMTAAVTKHMRPGDEVPSSAFRRAVYWHWANLEYGCSADLDQVHIYARSGKNSNIFVSRGACNACNRSLVLFCSSVAESAHRPVVCRFHEPNGIKMSDLVHLVALMQCSKEDMGS